MLRHAHLDASGTLHHLMVRGIERTRLFRDAPDWADFIARLAGPFFDSLLACTPFPQPNGNLAERPPF